MAETRKPFHETVAERLIAQLEAGTAPWQRPWAPGEPGAVLPLNPTTGKRYKGINAIHLMSQGRADNRWMTYRQAAAVGAQVRKGEKGTPVQYWQFSEEQVRRDEAGRPVLDGDGEPVKQTVQLERPRVFFATVFNAEQIDGLPPLAHTAPAWDALERAEHILAASGAVIRHGEQNRAFYRPATDTIHLPERSQFPGADTYYATALHELGHWTGHASRLARDLAHPFGSEGYAKEELRAEIASMILGDELGIGHDPGQHAAYVGSWIKALRDDPLEIFRAAAEAEKIKDYVLAFEQQQQVQVQGLEHDDAARASAQQMHPDAFLDSTSVLRRWASAEPLPADWQGLARSDTTFFYVGREGEERSFTPLNAATFEDARREAAVVRALAVDIDAILGDPEVTFSHFEAFVGASLPEALRSRGLTTVGHVTGHDPGQFREKAHDRLSPVFGLEPADSRMGEPYLERKGLAQAFALKAEQLFQTLQQGQETNMAQAPQQAAPEVAETWTLEQLEHGTLMRALETANFARIERVAEVLDAMQPLNTQNAFWTRHALPQDPDALDAKIAAAIEPLEQLREEAMVGEARKAGDRAAFDRAARDAFDIALPHDWNGQVVVQASAEVSFNGATHVVAATDVGVAPRLWSVYAQREDGRLAFVQDFGSARKAEHLAFRLTVIAAHSSDDEQERAAILARAHEDRVRRDPDRTDEDVRAAEAARKAADLDATLAAADRQGHGAEHLAQAGRTYLQVPYKDKDEAKALGARWDRQEQAWYLPPGVNWAPFAKWMQAAAEPRQGPRAGPQAGQDRIYLAVPYGERAAAKAAGAAWDRAARSWYAGPKADLERLQRWLPDNVSAQQAPAMSPRDEFTDALRSVGCELSGDHPIMDGRTHRIGVEGDRKGEQAGFYVAHLDGHPAGYIKNNRTGVAMTWKSKGYVLDDQEKARWAAEAAGKLAARAREQERAHEAAAQRVVKQLADLAPVVAPTPYIRSKGIQVHPGVFTDKEGKTTCIPAYDVHGKQWTMQYIQEDGTKRFAKDSRKDGCFHAVGGLEALARAPALVISEGYATAATNAEVLGFATVAAFDSGNLAAVARALHETFPDKPVLILGDDDRQLELTQGTNAGRVKAEEAAKAVGGKALLPIFAPGENAYPAELPPITPQRYRAHLRATKALEDAQKASEGASESVKLTGQQVAELKGALLSDLQMAALEHMKAHTDFNDLATRSVLGREGVERQLKAKVSRVIHEDELKREHTPEPEKEHNIHAPLQPRRVARIA
ncbi:zincin-like metallopeptidase domain-containing protein [Thauera sp. 2A1]|uniref:zincin-like metallopeptidase domain-containing protein n=1 Tax=Thauera sp. 2A1 TaxID=2570191 RepID=UPI001D17B67E|nr:zincin-like metallopeptidase domain-containing protein [Thauera sp. 2A1]KAI5912224.1 zincin-like metallopeptidase domain-containing protein [Thauera sp. 2A1]KAI5915049.1 zincin-like metallopeptidase domain-containing protein [Thauera sp. 2A1]